MKLYVNSILILLLVNSCQNDVIKNEIITFSLKELPELSEVKLSDLGFTGIEYVPLETTEQNMISNIEGLYAIGLGDFRIIGDDNYFLIKIFSTIYLFNNNGSFVSRIGVQGRGPNEFTAAHDVDINKKDHKIYLAAGWQNKFNVYSDDGQFVRTFKAPIHGPVDFRLIDDNILCYSENMLGNIENSYLLMDSSGYSIKAFRNKYSFTKSEGPAIGFRGENIFYRFNNKLYKKEIYSDTIYSFEGNNFKPHMVIELGERLLTPEARSEHSGEYIVEHYIDQLNLLEFGDFIYYGFVYKIVLFREVDRYGFIGSKTCDYRALFDLHKGIINDLDVGPNIIPLTTKDDNTIISMVDALTLKNHILTEEFKNSTPKYPEKKKELEKLAASLKETDNPVLVLVRLKE